MAQQPRHPNWMGGGFQVALPQNQLPPQNQQYQQNQLPPPPGLHAPLNQSEQHLFDVGGPASTPIDVGGAASTPIDVGGPAPAPIDVGGPAPTPIDQEALAAARILEATNEMKQHFAHQHMLTYETVLGNGVYGATFRVLEKRRNRRLVIKRSIRPEGDAALRNEIAIMQVGTSALAIRKHFEFYLPPMIHTETYR